METVLKMRKCKFTKACRGSSINYNRYDLIITLGGDGTFLEAARHVENQIVLGVNSDPAWSVGRFCWAHPKNFEKLLDKILAGHWRIKKFNRLRLSFSDGTNPMNVLNDILVCHENPAAMSRYYITIGKIKEEQRSSGIWIPQPQALPEGFIPPVVRFCLRKRKRFNINPGNSIKDSTCITFLKERYSNPFKKSP